MIALAASSAGVNFIASLSAYLTSTNSVDKKALLLSSSSTSIHPSDWETIGYFSLLDMVVNIFELVLGSALA